MEAPTGGTFGSTAISRSRPELRSTGRHCRSTSLEELAQVEPGADRAGVAGECEQVLDRALQPVGGADRVRHGDPGIDGSLLERALLEAQPKPGERRA